MESRQIIFFSGLCVLPGHSDHVGSEDSRRGKMPSAGGHIEVTKFDYSYRILLGNW